MGLQHSGHVANTAFYERVEKHVLPFCTLQHGIISYSRFYDDILIVASSRDAGRDLIQRLKQHQSYFLLVCSGVSQTGLKHLDVWVDITGACIRVEPKLDSEVIPLT